MLKVHLFENRGNIVIGVDMPTIADKARAPFLEFRFRR
jgi:hypothetical protein